MWGGGGGEGGAKAKLSPLIESVCMWGWGEGGDAEAAKLSPLIESVPRKDIEKVPHNILRNLSNCPKQSQKSRSVFPHNIRIS